MDIFAKKNLSRSCSWLEPGGCHEENAGIWLAPCYLGVGRCTHDGVKQFEKLGVLLGFQSHWFLTATCCHSNWDLVVVQVAYQFVHSYSIQEQCVQLFLVLFFIYVNGQDNKVIKNDSIPGRRFALGKFSL